MVEQRVSASIVPEQRVSPSIEPIVNVGRTMLYLFLTYGIKCLSADTLFCYSTSYINNNTDIVWKLVLKSLTFEI